GLRLLSSCGGTPRSLPSFPTRRSSDLVAHRAEGGNVALVAGPGGVGLVDRGDELTGLGDAVGRFAEAEQRIEVHRLVREQPDRGRRGGAGGRRRGGGRRCGGPGRDGSGRWRAGAVGRSRTVAARREPEGGARADGAGEEASSGGIAGTQGGRPSPAGGAPTAERPGRNSGD